MESSLFVYSWKDLPIHAGTQSWLVLEDVC